MYIPLPDMEGRRELFRINLKSLELGEGVDFDELATKSAGYSGADVANVCRCDTAVFCVACSDALWSAFGVVGECVCVCSLLSLTFSSVTTARLAFAYRMPY